MGIPINLVVQLCQTPTSLRDAPLPSDPALSLGEIGATVPTGVCPVKRHVVLITHLDENQVNNRSLR